nr:hypothetical protein CFP56_44239 [Quercus suber]
MYGTDGLAADDTYFYFLARNDAYFKIARVEKNARTDVSQYDFYHPSSGQWTKVIPAPDSTSADDNFFTGTDPANGVQFGSDLFFSPYFNTWLLSYSSNAFGNGIFNLAYSTTGLVEGPYEDLGPVFGPPLDEGCDQSSPNYNPIVGVGGNIIQVYLTHAHPGYDPSGKTLTVGWISCNTFTNFAKITFAIATALGASLHARSVRQEKIEISCGTRRVIWRRRARRNAVQL